MLFANPKLIRSARRNWIFENTAGDNVQFLLFPSAAQRLSVFMRYDNFPTDFIVLLYACYIGAFYL
jgi:hypothetical protein